MEPQLIDYYNEMPSGINVIDKMNEELTELQKKYDKLDKVVNKYKIPCFKVDTVEEYNEWTNKFEKFCETVHDIIKDEENGLMSILKFSLDGPWPCNVASLYGSYKKGIRRLPTIRRMDGGGNGWPKPNHPQSILSEELNKLTKYKNDEWAYNRVKYSFKQILDDYKYEDIDNIDLGELSDRIDEHIINSGGNEAFNPEEPILYCNFIPENCEENEEYPDSSTYLYNIIYYDCEKCNKLSRYGEPENVDNKLLCCDCFTEYTDNLE
jgi:hypothetical protein